ncbi:MAG: DUF4358 domain-containing protein [Lachnospiraceae bacterium]|nr:DUF4358 domain-containing protein [Lachnospiraceae bacterium]
MKRLFTAVLVTVIAMCLAACGSAKSTDAVSVGEKVMKKASGFPEMKTITSNDKDADINFSTLCDFDYSKVSSFYYAYASDGTAPEVAVVSLKSADDTADLMSSIKDHVKTREGTMQEYTPDQVAMVQSYILVQKNGTVGFFIGKGAASLEKSFKAEVK